MEKIKRTGVLVRRVAPNGVPVLTDTDSAYSLQDIISKVNTKDKRFLKNFPDQMLTNAQKQAKSEALLEDKRYLQLLKKQYNSATMTEERIDYLIKDSGAGARTDYAQAWITSINPTDFINLTTKDIQNREVFDKIPGDYGSTVDEYDYIEGLKKETRQTPYLAINYKTNQVVGHEGRHRMRALEKDGITSAEIKVEFRDNDGSVIKELNGYGNPLNIIDSLEIFNERGTKQSATIENIIPLTLNGQYMPHITYNYPLDSDLELRGIPQLDSNNNLYYDGDVYESNGTVTRQYGTRAYESGDETLTNAITDGINTVYKLTSPITEQATAYTNPQYIDGLGTEEYIDTRAVAIPVGHNSQYSQDLKSKIENIPSLPQANGTYTLKCTVSGGTTTLSWVSG